MPGPGKPCSSARRGSTSIRYYQKEHEFLGVDVVWAIGLSRRGSERTRFSFTQSANYSPAYFYGLFPSFMSLRCRGHRDDGRRRERLCRQQRLGPGLRNVGEPDAQPDGALELQPVGHISVFAICRRTVGARIFAPTVSAGDTRYDLSRNATLHLGYDLSGRPVLVRRQRAVDRCARYRRRRRLPQAVVVFTPHARRLQRRFVDREHADL